MFQPAALRNAISWGGNGPRLRRSKPGARKAFDSSTAGFLAAPSTLVGPYGLFSTNPFLDLPYGRALRHPRGGP
jgi:hypothetical protein